VDAGNLVHASDPAGLVVLTQVQPMTVVFSLPEDDVREVVATAAGAAPLVVTALDRGGKLTLATGRLLTPDNQIDPTTGTFRLKAVFDNAHDELFPNQFVNVRLLLATHKDRVVVPATAVQRGQQGAFVFGVLPDDTVKLQTVTVGATVGDDVEITNGLGANDTVVVDGADRLVDGARVEPQSAAPGAASPPRKPKA
jgi:multidrug efflux system membrane fusion protein